MVALSFNTGLVRYTKLSSTFALHCIPYSSHPSSLHHPFLPTPVSSGHAYCAIPMTPQAGRPPAFPVFLLSSLPPLPRSSVPACTTMVRPRILSGPISLTCLSVMLPLALPLPSVEKLPRSPTWRSLSSGAPCVLLRGLTVRRKDRQLRPGLIFLRSRASRESQTEEGSGFAKHEKMTGLTVRSSARAAIGVVAEGMDVHASLGVGVMAGDVP